jgi:hypothetical protein
MSTEETTTNTRSSFKPDLVWSYWAVTTVLIIGALAGIEYSYQAVVALNIVQVIHFSLREKSVTAFPVQVRTTYLGLLFLSQAPYMIWILWWQLIGTAAMVSFNYCFLARCMSLMPWNKSEDYSIGLFKRTFFTAPVDGNVLHGLPAKAI